MLRRMKQLRARLAVLLVRVIAVAVVLLPGTAMAQVTAPPEATNRSDQAPSLLIGFGIIFVLLLIVMVVSLIPSKRGHQD